MNQKSNIKNLLKNYSIEITPKVYEKISSIKDFLNSKTNVYITYLPDENTNNILNTAKKIIDEGLDAIPHLPARTIKNKSDLEKYIGSLSEVAGVKKILVIGGSSKQNGNINSSIEVLKTGFLDKYNYCSIGLAGHPEGNPDISQEKLDEAIIEKNKFALDSKAKLYLITQFFFEARSFIEWEKHLFKLDNKLEIHAGLPGPADFSTLIKFARSCGVKNSLNFLTKQALNISKMTMSKTPAKLVSELASYISNNEKTKLKNLHFYPFGGIKKTSSWIRSIIDE